MLGYSFSIITVMEERIPHLEQRVIRSGLKEKLTSIVPLGLSVADTERRPSATRAAILQAGRKAANVDGAEVLILACAGMGKYVAGLETELGVPIVSPTASGLKIAEMLVSLRLKHSKIRMHKQPSDEPWRTGATRLDDKGHDASTG
jgi:allantoin racemase